MKYIKLFSRFYTLQYVESYVRAIGPEYKKYTLFPVKGIVVLPENGNSVTYAPVEQWQKYLKVVEKVGKDKHKLEKYILNFHLAGKHYVKISKEIGRSDFKRVNNAGLSMLYKKYIQAQEKYNPFLWAGNYIGEHLGNIGTELIASKGFYGKEKDEAVKVFFEPSQKCGVLLLQAKMLKFKKQGYKKLTSQQAAKLLKEFAYLSCLDLNNKPWKAVDIEEFYRHYTPAETSSAEIKNKTRQIKFSRSQKQLLKHIQEISFIKDMRDVYRRKGVFYALPFFTEIAYRMGLSSSEVGFCTHGEIEGVLTGKIKIKKQVVISRAKGFLFYGDTVSPMVITDAREIKKFYEIVHSRNDEKDVSGIVASAGFVKGRAKVVFNVRDVHKVKKGDILVAVTTHPDFVPAMQKSAGIVTDEGGLTSHAAIVSRELGKPCIVGTKISTQVLKDGDLVEVDANKGIVRKL